MIRTSRRLWSLDPADRGLILEATALVLLARVGLHLWRFSTLRSLLDRAAEWSTASGVRPLNAERRVGWAIGVASRHLPVSTTCLVDALAGDVMLRRRGLESNLHFGVRAPDHTASSQLTAHAWVESGGTIVTGEAETLPAYAELAVAAPTVDDKLAALLRGEHVDWRALGPTPPDVVDVCERHDLTGLILSRLRSLSAPAWPSEILDDLTRAFRERAVQEALRRRELVGVIDELAANGVRPILFKGAALAYQVYSTPAARPRLDADLMIRREDVDVVRQVMSRLGYVAPPYCDGELLLCQFELSKQDGFGIEHTFDFHWKISTQVTFGDVVGYDDLAAESVHVPSLGSNARAAGPVHALLLACIHPAMHHRNEERLIWIHDVHQLVSRLTEADLDRFVALALHSRVAAVCAHELRLVRSRLGTSIPNRVLLALSTPPAPERSAGYLARERRWHHELLASMLGLSRWRDRLRLAREVLLPSRHYMLTAYGLPGGARSTALLPALYAHRAVNGAWKILTGRK